ncbi:MULTISPECIES: hypothetical protein [Lysinibacillus]|uniref:hypothetical protein n=1 Tax=Lysinibacillus TaxID=400634 RepID=UPI00214B33DF|nr:MULTISPECIES: hypothetical protein [Lysinibacillus]UUV25834.1 hypothetical protein NP781_04255 [Lysinibacillus sp. FN11]UYB48708.1 hypothetical protein OCI51_07050 [Lysinibacillus capsici]
MKQKFSALIEVRKLIALLTVLLFVTLSLMGNLETNFIQTVVISVISFYFGKTSNVNERGEK